MRKCFCPAYKRDEDNYWRNPDCCETCLLEDKFCQAVPLALSEIIKLLSDIRDRLPQTEVEVKTDAEAVNRAIDEISKRRS